MFLKLSPHCSLKKLEKPYIYDIENDELYEIDDMAEEFIGKCNGITPVSVNGESEEFVKFCLNERLLEISEKPLLDIGNWKLEIGNSPIPSLRYLELQLTAKCNLSCKHCYLGRPKNFELPFDSLVNLLKEFEDMQGLRLLISGGEPMLYSRFWEFNDMLPNYNFRKVLLTNGFLLGKEEASRLNVHEVQVSLDGLEKGHDALRGNGSFKRAVTAMDAVKSAGIDLSVATMAHRYNLYDFPKMSEMLKCYEVREWGIDVPLAFGNLENEKDFAVSPEEGAERMRFAFGGSYHGGSEGYACGRHLCTVIPTGKVCKCGFYGDNPIGDISEGIAACWNRNHHVPLKELECYGCEYIDECQGGCRFRAETPASPDPVMCALYGKVTSP